MELAVRFAVRRAQLAVRVTLGAPEGAPAGPQLRSTKAVVVRLVVRSGLVGSEAAAVQPVLAAS